MVTCQKNLGSVGIKFFFFLLSVRLEIVVPESDSGISFSKFRVSRHLLKLFYDENTQFFYLLCSQFRQKASGWINKTLLLIKQHITYMNISRYANIDKFVNIRYIFFTYLSSPLGIQLIISASPNVEITSPGRRARGCFNTWIIIFLYREKYKFFCTLLEITTVLKNTFSYVSTFY